MGSFSIWHWLVVLLVVLLLFGSGKISGLMGDLATGIKSFRKNMREEDDASMAATTTPTTTTGNLPAPGTTGQAAQPGATQTVVRQPSQPV
ncbi:twin-arginine translocase TatA/TatE family subunit [Roseomonas sp. CCTCC AB2023176]|uniref:twin-arginine translocase TatA/TatE family subunit n=1 Tax=Roseomonas sp. CCTCC AB2023176 TaxID=3342640 RepID=UPI0035DAB8C7